MQSTDFLTPEDLAEFIEDATDTKLQAIISDVWAEVLSEAPSLEDANQALVPNRSVTLVRAIMRAAAIRHEESRAGSLSTAQAMSGSYSEMSIIAGKGLLTSRQIKQLQDIEAEITESSSGAHIQEYDLFAGAHPSRQSLWVPIGRTLL